MPVSNPDEWKVASGRASSVMFLPNLIQYADPSTVVTLREIREQLKVLTAVLSFYHFEIHKQELGA